MHSTGTDRQTEGVRPPPRGNSYSLRDHWAEWPKGCWREALTPCTWTLPVALLGPRPGAGPETAAAGAETPPSRLLLGVVCYPTPPTLPNLSSVLITCNKPSDLLNTGYSNLCDSYLPWELHPMTSTFHGGWFFAMYSLPLDRLWGSPEDPHQTADIPGTESERKYLMAEQMNSFQIC